MLRKKTIAAYALCLLTLAEMIDTSIVSVALPQIMAAIGANIEQIAMITTSYVISHTHSCDWEGMCLCYI